MGWMDKRMKAAEAMMDYVAEHSPRTDWEIAMLDAAIAKVVSLPARIPA